MKIKIVPLTIILIAHLLINTSFGQAPQSFNYQAVARDASGAVISNQAVNFRISLLQGSATGTSSYTETHAVTTNLLGLVNFAIGGGTVISGNFSNINWAQGPYFAQIELDASNSGTYVLMSTTQLLSVPYAQYAEKSGNPTLHAGSGIAIQNDSIVNTAQNQQVNVSGTGQTNVTGTYPNYVVNTPNIQAGNGISVSGQTITNTAPDQVVSLNGTGHTAVTGTYPNFTVNTPNYVGGIGITISGNNISAQNSNAIWNANQLQGKNIDTLTPTIGKVLQYDGSKWKPSDKLPQMSTAQREALTNVYAGMTILNTNTDCIEYYTGTKWLATCGTAGNVGSSESGGMQQGGKIVEIQNAMQDTMSIQNSFTIGNDLYLISTGNSGIGLYFTKYNTNTKQFSSINNFPFTYNDLYGFANGATKIRTMAISSGTKGYLVVFKTYNPNLVIDIYEYNSISSAWSGPISNTINMITCANVNLNCVENDDINYIGLYNNSFKFIISGPYTNFLVVFNTTTNQITWQMNVLDSTNQGYLANGLQGYWKEGAYTYFSNYMNGLIKYSNQSEQGIFYIQSNDFRKGSSIQNNITNSTGHVNNSTIFDFNLKHYLLREPVMQGFYDLIEVDVINKSFKNTGLSFEPSQFGDITRIHDINGAMYLTSTGKLFKLVL